LVVSAYYFLLFTSSDNCFVIFLSRPDVHDNLYAAYEHQAPIEQYGTVAEGQCAHTVFIYPTNEFRESFNTSKPWTYTLIVAAAFLATAIVFLVYDIMVNRRQQKTMANAVRSNKIISSMFPKNVRDRLMDDAEQNEQPASTNKRGIPKFGSTIEKGLIQEDNGEASEDGPYKTKPIADLFPDVTVMVSITVTRETLFLCPSSTLFSPERSYAQPFFPSFDLFVSLLLQKVC